jgi:hypothetical protein
MQSRFQVIFTLAAIACFVCMAFARPATTEEQPVVPASMIKTPRLNHLLRRAENATTTSTEYDIPVDTPMKPYNTSGEPTREEALAKNGGTTKYQFNFEYADTDPLNDAHAKMAELNKKMKTTLKLLHIIIIYQFLFSTNNKKI